MDVRVTAIKMDLSKKDLDAIRLIIKEELRPIILKLEIMLDLDI